MEATLVRKNRFSTFVIVAAVATIAGAHTARAQSTPQGDLRIIVESLGNETLDPTLGPATVTKLYLPLIYDSLVGANKANTEISKETGIAKDWKISPDGKVYTFYIRQGVKFHNGDDLTAEDIKFSLERAFGPKAISSLAGVFSKAVDHITVDDPYTVSIYLKEPKFSFLLDISSLVSSEGMIVPKKYIEKVGEDKFAQEPIGSGPYRFKKHTAGFSVEFEAMPKHWGIGVPKFANVSFIAVPEQNTRLTMIKSDQADVISIGRRYVKEFERDGFTVATKPAANQMQILINNQWEKDSPLHDKRVREAIAHAIDSKAILNGLLLGAGELTRCWVTDVSYPARPAGLCDPDRYDPKAARQLLADAGYPNGIDITFRSYPTPGVPEKLEIDQAIAGYLRSVGIRARVDVGEYGAYRAQWPLPASLPKTIANNPTVSQIVIGSLVHIFFHGEGFLSTTRGVNPKADADINNMLAAPDLDTYKQRLMTAWGDLLNDYNVVMLFTLDGKYAANSKKLPKPWALGTGTADIGVRSMVTQ
jgi:peptide/nickel transport system substrate-binding protein